MARAIHLALLTAGAALLIALVRRIGVDALGADLHHFGHAFIGVIALELLLDACNTLGWRRTLAPGVSVGFWRLFWIRQAGTAVNQLTPTATLGGEVVKALLLRPRVASADAVASVLAAKLSFAIAQVLLVLVGLVVLLGRLRGAPGLRPALVLASVSACAAVGGFLVLQRRGMLGVALDALARLGIRSPGLARLRVRADVLDTRLAALHRERPAAFVASVAWHFAAQLLGTAQLFYILRGLGSPLDVMTCVAIEACALVIDSALFFVPGRVGVQEGSRVVVFAALGSTAATGLAVAVIVRLNQLVVSGLGLAAYGYLSLTSAPAAGSLTEG